MAGISVSKRDRALQLATKLINEGGPIASSAKSLVGVVPREETQSYAETIATQVGPQVMTAAYAFQKEYLESLEEEEALDEGDEYNNVQLTGNPQQLLGSDVEQMSAEETSLMVAAGAIMPRHTEGGPVVEQTQANWRGFLDMSLSAQQTGFMRRESPKVFSMFPCFKDLYRRNGSRSIDNNLHVVMRVAANENAPAGNQNAIASHPIMRRQMQLTNAQDDEVQRVGQWVRSNALAIQTATLKFPEVYPGYQPKILFAVSEDESFLLVEENAGTADYAYDSNDHHISITIKGDNTISHGDCLKTIRYTRAEAQGLDLAYGVNFEENSNLRLLVENYFDGTVEVKVIYIGEQSLTAGDSVVATLHADQNHPSSELIRETIEQGFDPLGVMGVTNGGDAPIDAKYIYKWPGGRKHYANNPKDLEGLISLMSAKGALEINMREAGIAQVAHTQAPQAIASRTTAPAPAPAQAPAERPAEAAVATTPEPAASAPVRPVTTSAPPKAKPSAQKVRLIARLRNEMGFKLSDGVDGDGEKKVKVATIQHGETFVVAIPADGLHIVSSKTVSVEIRSDLNTPGVQIGFLEDTMDLDSMNEIIMKSGIQPTMKS